MFSSDHAATIGCSFIAAYYDAFVDDSRDFPIEFYSESSSVSVADHSEVVGITSQGKVEIKSSLERLFKKLGERKVCILHADYTAANGTVVVVCTGRIHTRTMRRVFTHTFTLFSTANRENTVYIGAECFRILSEDHEPQQQQAPQPAVQQQQSQPKATAEPREKPSKGAYKEGFFVMLKKLSNKIRRNEITQACDKYGKVLDCSWHGEEGDAVVQFDSKEAAVTLIRESKEGLFVLGNEKIRCMRARI